VDLTEAILQRNVQLAERVAEDMENFNYLDEYGYTPLIQSVIANEIEITKFLLDKGADPNQQDSTGSSALHWSIYNNNYDMSALLLSHKADPNSYNTASEPALAKPILRNDYKPKQLLLENGASPQFAQDYIKVKLLGHQYELTGSVDIVDTNGVFTEVDYEGFFLESTLDLIHFSLVEFQNNFAARPLQHWFSTIRLTIQCLSVSQQLLRYDHYLTEHKDQVKAIKNFLTFDSFILPLNQQGHALSLVKHGHLIAIVDRAKDSPPNDRIPIYFLNRSAQLNPELLFALVFERQDIKTIHKIIKNRLALQEVDSLSIPDQHIGNCSWANIEATLPVMKLMTSFNDRLSDEEREAMHSDCLELFHRWQRWGRERNLTSVIRDFKSASPARRACMAALFAAIIFQRCHVDNDHEFALASQMLPMLLKKEYDYIIESYKKFYIYEKPTQAGTNFLEIIERYRREA
jgi:hypothetical protein